MDFTCIFFGILFTLAGLWFAFGKGYLHLSLWKNMPQKEKDKLRIIPLCRNIGLFIKYAKSKKYTINILLWDCHLTGGTEQRITGTIPTDCRYCYLRFVVRIVRNNHRCYPGIEKPWGPYQNPHRWQ